MKLTYWYCERLDDHQCYSIVTKTKTEALKQIALYGEGCYEQPVKKTIEFKDSFDLFQKVTGEGGSRAGA